MNLPCFFSDCISCRNFRMYILFIYHGSHYGTRNFGKIAAARGKPAPFLPAPYNWKTYPQMNVAFWETHQSTSYTDAEAMLKKTHKEVMALIETFSNEELFSKGAFDWTGTTTLGSYCVSATSSHYDWAFKDIKKALKKYRTR